MFWAWKKFLLFLGFCCCCYCGLYVWLYACIYRLFIVTMAAIIVTMDTYIYSKCRSLSCTFSVCKASTHSSICVLFFFVLYFLLLPMPLDYYKQRTPNRVHFISNSLYFNEVRIRREFSNKKLKLVARREYLHTNFLPLH